jgi:hypothetical protein
MERYFGRDLRDVRLHLDGAAMESAEALGAMAYSFRNHIVFAPNMYAPAEASGARILVHELTHCLQQSQDWERPRLVPETTYDSAHDYWESEAERHALFVAHRGTRKRSPIGRPITPGPAKLACLGANAGCTEGQRAIIHQAIFDANAWVNNALRKLEASTLPALVAPALRRNFGSTYGVTANLQLFIDRIRVTRGVMNRMPIACNSTHQICVDRHCGFADAGSLAATICTVTFEPQVTPRMRARCVLHESFHATFRRFIVDVYSSGHGDNAADPSYPGTGVDPLLNADSYTTLVMDLS